MCVQGRVPRTVLKLVPVCDWSELHCKHKVCIPRMTCKLFSLYGIYTHTITTKASSLLSAMWINNHTTDWLSVCTCAQVRMAERSEALRSSCSLPWRRGFEFHLWQPEFFTVGQIVACNTILGKKGWPSLGDECLTRKPQRFSLYTLNLCTQSNVLLLLLYSSCSTMCSMNCKTSRPRPSTDRHEWAFPTSPLVYEQRIS